MLSDVSLDLELSRPLSLSAVREEVVLILSPLVFPKILRAMSNSTCIYFIFSYISTAFDPKEISTTVPTGKVSHLLID
jgi:hypothetical protein